MAGGGRRRRHPRLDRQLVPASAQPGRATFPVEDLVETYDTMLSERHVTPCATTDLPHLAAQPLLQVALVAAVAEHGIEGINLADAAAIKQAVKMPVICTGGFQTASVIRGAIDRRRLRRA